MRNIYALDFWYVLGLVGGALPGLLVSYKTLASSKAIAAFTKHSECLQFVRCSVSYRLSQQPLREL